MQTVAISDTRRGEVVERIRAACGEGRQAYWVCTLIEESEQLEAQAAEVAHAELVTALPDLRIGLVHGRMKPADKQRAMEAFKAGEIKLLVATTVIEVGVDVPNASLMIIENAERLGLAQLHQLRGRVGRGSAASSCVLMYRTPLSAMARARLEVMRETGDGFRIAEKDLELRGPGEMLGTRQTGQIEFRVADLARDAHLLPAVQRVGAALLRRAPGIGAAPDRTLDRLGRALRGRLRPCRDFVSALSCRPLAAQAVGIRGFARALSFLRTHVFRAPAIANPAVCAAPAVRRASVQLSIGWALREEVGALGNYDVCELSARGAALGLPAPHGAQCRDLRIFSRRRARRRCTKACAAKTCSG